MGRGRAKAKQTKVARDLKYNSGGMDLDRLRADLVGDHEDEVDPELLARYGDLAASDASDASDTGDTGDEADGDDADDADADGRYATGR
jgi:hypothetical protein